MITDMVDLDPLVGQYDSGIILVGPLLSHSKNSRYHYFYIAGDGSKIFETIKLGFVEVETIARTQRANFVGKLESRFSEVLVFGGLLELAHAVHARWPNVETARFLAFAELEGKSEPTKVADEAAPERVVSAEGIDDNLAYAPPRARDQMRPTPVLRPAQMVTPSVPIATFGGSLSGDRTVTERQRQSGLSEGDIAPATLRLKSPAERGGVPRLPVGDRSLASIILRYCAVGGAVALTSAVVTWAIVRPSARQIADEAAPAHISAPSISVSRNEDPSQAEAAVPPSDPNYFTAVKEPTATAPPSPSSQISVNKDPSQAEATVAPSLPNPLTKTNEPAPQAEPTPAATVRPPPQSQPLQVASAPTGAAPISGSQPLPAQVGGTASRLDAEEIATLVNRGTDYLKSGNLASARLLLRRAAEAGSASAALMLGTTFDPLFIQQLGTIGVAPDVAQARQWYEQAAALGSEAASERLAKLPHTNP
jgi:hypothetical protein